MKSMLFKPSNWICATCFLCYGLGALGLPLAAMAFLLGIVLANSFSYILFMSWKQKEEFEEDAWNKICGNKVGKSSRGYIEVMNLFKVVTLSTIILEVLFLIGKTIF